LTIFNVTFS